MMSVVAILTNIELFSYIGKTESEGDVKATRRDMAGALLGFAELPVERKKYRERKICTKKLQSSQMGLAIKP